MKSMKTIFPRSFSGKEPKDVLLAILYYVLLNVVAGFIFGVLEGAPVLGFVFSILQYLLTAYVFMGISFAVLYYFNVIK